MIETMYTTPLLPLGNFCLFYKPVSLHLAAATERHPRSLHSVRVSGLGLLSSGMTGSLWINVVSGAMVALLPPLRILQDGRRATPLDMTGLLSCACHAGKPTNRHQ